MVNEILLYLFIFCRSEIQKLRNKLGTDDPHNNHDNMKDLEANFLVPDWGAIADSGVGLSYRPARLHRLPGQYQNPMTESAISQSQGLKEIYNLRGSCRFRFFTVVLSPDQYRYSYVVHPDQKLRFRCLMFTLKLRAAKSWCLLWSSGQLKADVYSEAQGS